MIIRFCKLCQVEPTFLYSTPTLHLTFGFLQQVSLANSTYSTRYCACAQQNSAKDSRTPTLTCFMIILLVERVRCTKIQGFIERLLNVAVEMEEVQFNLVRPTKWEPRLFLSPTLGTGSGQILYDAIIIDNFTSAISACPIELQCNVTTSFHHL